MTDSELVGYPELPAVEFDKKYIEDLIVSLYFQLNRKTSQSIKLLSNLLKNALDYLHLHIEKPVSKTIANEYLLVLYRMIGQTRDRYLHGKGEQLVSYMMIYCWYDYFPELACFLIQTFVVGKYSYGSWRDIKYLCDYVRSQSNENHPLIQYCVRFMNEHLRNEYVQSKFENPRFTCISKWIPRENKKFHWLYNLLVVDWFSNNQSFMLSKCEYQSIKYFAAISKCKKIYRQMISSINKNINTIECKLCDKTYNEIKPKTIPQIAFMKYKKFLLNDVGTINGNSEEESSTIINTLSNRIMSDMDNEIAEINKILCRQRIAMYFYLKHFPTNFGFYDEFSEKQLLSNIPVSYYVTEALKLITNMELSGSSSGSGGQSKNIISNRQLLNKQWAQYSSNIGIKKLHGFIPFLDMSESMYGEPLHTAIGIACLIAERTTFGKKILVYDNQPTWINLDHCGDGDFVSMIEHIYHSTRATTKTRSNVLSAVHLLLYALVSSNYTDINIGLVKCVFISNQYSSLQSLTIKHIFSNKSKPCPILVHWNVSSSFFPDIKVEPRCFFFSGDSIYPLKMLDINHIATPYEVARQVINHERYDKLEEAFLNS